MEQLKQRHYHRRRTFRLLENGVRVEEAAILERRRYKIPFEQISSEPIEITVFSKLWAWLTGIACIISGVMFFSWLFEEDVEIGAGLFYGAFALVFGVRLFLSRESYVGFRGREEALLFYKDKPTHKELKAFIEELHAAKQAYLQENYLHVSIPSSIPEEIQRLAWLKDQGALTEEEYATLKQDLVKESKRRGSGFGFTN